MMRIDGACHCGRITFEAEADPAEAYACHCADCQAISGSPYRWAVSVPKESFSLLTGTTKVYEKTAASGRPNHQHFCADCASPIYSTTPGREPAVVRVRLGTVRQRDRFVPRQQSWCGSAQEWAMIEGAERRETQ